MPNRRGHILIAALAFAAGCGGSSGGSRGGASVAAATSASGAVGPVGTVTSGSSAPVTSAPRVGLAARGLAISGRTRALLGAEVQYYRIRDAQWDVARTHQLWEEALDQAQAAGAELITTYVPWDFHEETQGTFDFAGTRDLERFLDSCFRRGLLVHVKPGPFINSEWPNGLGSFGAIPQWWKEQNPGALARRSDGKPFSFDLLGRAVGRQPSFFAPEHRAAASRWFARVAPIIKKFVFDRPTIAMLQIDNETNFYFKSRFDTDYSVHGIAQFRGWLAKKYGSVAALNAAYGTTYPSFDAVPAPTKAPAKPDENLPAQDWFDAGKDGIAEYHQFLRGEWEKLGLREPDVLFTTNDSPHPMPSMDLLLWDGPTKNKAGLAQIDAYPKQFPWSGKRPLDYPFLTSFFTKRFIEASQDYAFAGKSVPLHAGFAAELEGGLFDLPLGVPLEIPASTTDQILLEFFGHGGTCGTIYAFRGGLNRDGSEYFKTAAVAPDGRKTARYDVVSRFGNGLVGKHGDALLASEDVEAKVALVVGAAFDAPASGVAGHPGWIQAKEAPAIFGWLEDAGLSPAVIDGRRVKKGSLDRFAMVVYVNPDAAGDELAVALDDYVKRGGSLVNLIHAGRHDGAWRTSGVAPTLLAQGLFSDGRLVGEYEEKLGFALPPHVNFALPNGKKFSYATAPFLGKYDLSGPAQPFAHDRTFPFGANGKAAGWMSPRGSGRVFFLGTSPARAFRDWTYYDASTREILDARDLARWLAGECKVAPALEVVDANARVFARRVDAGAGGGSLVFVGNRLDAPTVATVRVLDLAALGLDAKTGYSLEDVLTGKSLGKATGADLAGAGFKVSLDPFASAVIRIR